MELIKVEIEVSGQPRGKGRPRFTRNGHTYTDAKTKEYEKRIHAAAWQKMRELKLKPVGKFCHLEVIAFMEIPKSWSKVKQLEAEFGAIKPITKPDLDNIIKAAKDGISGLDGIILDDKQVTSINAKKVYCHPERGAVLYICVSWTE
jgi:Holliday junction resolvase RusA-like endonuclease